MNRRGVSLIEILQPPRYQITPERARVTRTIIQPEIDSFEAEEARSRSQQATPPRARVVDSARL